MRPEVRITTGCSKCGSCNAKADQSCQSVYVERKEGYWKNVGGVIDWEYRWATRSKLVWFDYRFCLDCSWLVTKPVNSSDPIVGSAGYAVREEI